MLDVPGMKSARLSNPSSVARVPADAVLRGLLWMFLSSLAFASMIMCVRVSSAKFTTFEMTFWRSLFGVLILLPFMARGGFVRLRTRQLGYHTLRSVIQFTGVVLWFYAIGHINLSQGQSLQFTVPLFTVGLAAIFLGERVDIFRWIATLSGFAGVLIILRPGFNEVSVVAILTVVSAACYGGANVVTKVLQREDSSETIVFYMCLMHTPVALIIALALGFTIPALADWPALVGIAIAATLAHYFLAQGLGAAPAGVVMPFDFLKLPVVTALAYVLFAEIPDLWAWIGAVVICGATYFVMRRETRLGRSAVKAAEA